MQASNKPHRKRANPRSLSLATPARSRRCTPSDIEPPRPPLRPFSVSAALFPAGGRCGGWSGCAAARAADTVAPPTPLPVPVGPAFEWSKTDNYLVLGTDHRPGWTTWRTDVSSSSGCRSGQQSPGRVQRPATPMCRFPAMAGDASTRSTTWAKRRTQAAAVPNWSRRCCRRPWGSAPTTGCACAWTASSTWSMP